MMGLRRSAGGPADCVLLYITTANSEEASRLGKTLVAERLAACANVVPVITSFFHWQGALCQESEALLLVKTTRDMAERVAARARELHSYENPAILVLEVGGGSEDFLRWIAAEVAPAGKG